MRVDRKKTLEFIFFPIALGITLAKFLPVAGWLGHDYYYSFIRLFIGAVHFWQNFPALPHYTPSLCGGIPFFADPQSVYFSLPQLFAFFVDPLTATWISIAIFHCLGYWGSLKLFRSVCGYGSKVAHLGALAFLLNGFSFAHLYVGHLTHHSYLIFPCLLYLLFKSHGTGRALWQSVALFSFLLTYMFHAGTFHMLIVFSAVILLALPLLFYRKSESKELKTAFWFLGLSCLVLAATCSGKLAASILYSKNFVHAPVDTSGQSTFSLVFKYFWFDPRNTPLFITFGKFAFGPWEYVGYVSRFLIPLLVLFPFLALQPLNRKKVLVACCYLVLIPVLCQIAAGSPWNNQIPFIRRYHNPIKLLGAFVPFLVWIYAYMLYRASLRISFSSERTRFGFFAMLAVILMIEHFGYARYFQENKTALAYVHSPQLYSALKEQGGIAPVRKIVQEKGRDINGLQDGCSSMKCYEPLFGYLGESMKADLVVGPTSTIRDGRFNMNHPGCLLYPDYFHCKAWDRIPASDKENFETFIRGGVPSWGVPPWQSALLYLNLFSVLSLALPFLRLRWSFRPWKLPVQEEVGA